MIATESILTLTASHDDSVTEVALVPPCHKKTTTVFKYHRNAVAPPAWIPRSVGWLHQLEMSLQWCVYSRAQVEGALASQLLGTPFKQLFLDPHRQQLRVHLPFANRKQERTERVAVSKQQCSRGRFNSYIKSKRNQVETCED